MKNIILTLSFVFCLQVNAQDKPYVTQEENLVWVNNLKNIQLKSDKIDLIKAKIYSDTLYEKRIIIDNSRDPKKHICQTLFVIKYLDKYYKIDLRENPNLTSIMKYINKKNVNEIKILDFPENAIQYGLEGKCSVVTINSNKKLGEKLMNVFQR